jgi:hypothetical protein
LRVGGKEIRTTAEHPFFVKGKCWLPAAELVVGNELASEDGEWLLVEGVEDTGSSETVYNFRVADFATYFVGCVEWGFSVWAHNVCVYRGMREAGGLPEIGNTKKQLGVATEDDGATNPDVRPENGVVEALTPTNGQGMSTSTTIAALLDYQKPPKWNGKAKNLEVWGIDTAHLTPGLVAVPDGVTHVSIGAAHKMTLTELRALLASTRPFWVRQEPGQ